MSRRLTLGSQRPILWGVREARSEVAARPNGLDHRIPTPGFKVAFTVKITIDRLVHPLHRSVPFGEADVMRFPLHASCPVCRDVSEPEVLTEIGCAHWRQRLSIVQCRECELVYYRNPPGDDWLRDFYRQNWNSGTEQAVRDGSVSPSSKTKPRMAWLLADLGIEDRKARIIDVGCGVGALMAGLAEAGFSEIWGTELSDYRVAASRARFPGRVFAGGYKGVPDEFRFDVIYSHHVLEHIRVPADAIDWIEGHLDRSGVVVLSVPDMRDESVPNQIFFLPHLHSFGPSSLQRLAESRGLRCIFWKGARPGELTAVFSRDPAFRGGRPHRFMAPEEAIGGRSDQPQKARMRGMWDTTHQREEYRSIYAKAGDGPRGYSIPGATERAYARTLGLGHRLLARAGLSRLRSLLPFKTGYLRFRREDDADEIPSVTLAGGRGAFNVK